MGHSENPTHLSSASIDNGTDTVVRAGDVVGRYQIIASVGRGGMGEVFSAHDPELHRTVALKFLNGSVTAAGATDRLIREARAASALNHPNIVTVYDLIRTGGSLAIAMELIEGKSIRAWCGGCMSPEQVKTWATQIAEALAAAHQCGIIHRDIKPENVMVRTDGRIKILDFGLARKLACDKLSGTSELPTGTLRYLSPEQLRGQPATAASDIFSLGIVLYELTTGAHPFERDYPLATGHAIANDPAVHPVDRNAGVSREMGTLIMEMLAKEPAARPSAARIVRRLSRRDEEITSASRQGQGNPEAPRLAWLAATLLVLGAILLMVVSRV